VRAHSGKMASAGRGSDRSAGRGPAGGKGFTYFELLIVAAVFLIMLMVGIPRMGTAVKHFRLRSAAWQLGGDLRLARQRAVTLRRRVRVCVSSCAISVPAGSYSVEIDRGTPSSPNYVSETGRAVTLPDGVGLASSSASAIFASTGMASGSTFTLGIDVPNATGGTDSWGYRVVVNSTGQVVVTDCQKSC
jgi:Tfp pilus assembly protein FimT